MSALRRSVSSLKRAAAGSVGLAVTQMSITAMKRVLMYVSYDL